MRERDYIRLTHSRSRSAVALVSASRASLWLGRDHLLCIDSIGYTEQYKRFYFRDIQALLFRETSTWKIRASIFGLLTLGFGLIAVATPIVRWIFAGLAGLLLLCALLDVAFGPTCVAHLRTAVQTERLVSLNRIRKARRILARLRPLIVAAQGELPPEELSARLEEWARSNPGPTAAPADSPRYVVDDPDAPPRIVS